VNQGNIAIVSSVNQSYALPLAVMLDSAKQHLKPGQEVELYLVHAGLPPRVLETISSIIETHPILLHPKQISVAPRSQKFSPEASVPLLLAEILPVKLDRVLFLDADLLVLDDLTELWQTPLENCPLAAVADSAVPHCSSPRGVKNWQKIGIPGEAPYFNAGVMLIRLERQWWGEIVHRAFQYLRTTPGPVDFLHQEALNAVLWNNWKQLDKRWNLLATEAGRPHGRMPKQACRRPGIVHFAGRIKPWRTPVGRPFHSLYQQALARVAADFTGEPPTPAQRLCGFYDRFFRDVFYPLERILWKYCLI
jgi:lipopolysaccharide biosynthesis glycosyltransferase